jgi:preprotein translocase subunit SecY
MSRKMFIYSLVVALLATLGIVEYTTYTGDLPPIFHVIKVVIIFGALSSLMRKVEVLSNRTIMSVLSAASVGQLLYIIYYQQWHNQLDGETVVNAALLVLLMIFFVFTWQDKKNDSP